jgi:hypothetical protein
MEEHKEKEKIVLERCAGSLGVKHKKFRKREGHSGELAAGTVSFSVYTTIHQSDENVRSELAVIVSGRSFTFHTDQTGVCL